MPGAEHRRHAPLLARHVQFFYHILLDSFVRIVQSWFSC